MANKNNVNKPRTAKRGGPKRQSRSASKVAKTRNALGPPTASNTKSGVAHIRAISKKKMNKKNRNDTYKRQRQVAEAMEKEGEVEMKNGSDEITEPTKKALRKAAIAAEGEKFAEEKKLASEQLPEVAAVMDVDDDDAI